MESERNPEQYLQGVEYPADRDELISAAQNNNAPQDFIEDLASLKSEGQFSSFNEVLAEVGYEHQEERAQKS